MTMPTQQRVSLAVIVTLIATSVFHGLILCGEVGLADAWLLIRNDPGKFVFHLLLLPVSAGALAWSFPLTLARDCLTTPGLTRNLVVTTALALVVLSVGIGIQETVDGFEKRIPVPTDVAAVVSRDGTSRPARAPLLETWHALHATDWVPAPGPRHSSSAPYVLERARAYDEKLRDVLGPRRHFLTQGSAGAWWAGVLSTLGVLFIAAWVLTVIIVALRHRMLDERTTGTLVVAFCIGLASTGVWFYFKIYSAWYINFYSIPTADLAPLFMTLLAALALALAAVLVQHAQQPLAWFGRVAAVGGIATGLAAYWRPELLRSMAEAYRLANDASVVGLWSVLAVTAFVAAYLTATGGPPAP
jgi:hypothetical protein